MSAPEEALAGLRRPGWAGLLRMAVGLAVTVLFTLAVLGQIDGPALLAALAEARPGWLVAGLGLLVLAYGCKVLRWRGLLLRLAPSVPAGLAARSFMTGIALNNLLPLRAGDVARILVFRRALGVPATGLLAAVAVERLLDLCSLLLVAALVAALVPADLLPREITGGIGVLSLLAAIGVVGVLALPGPAVRLCGWLAGRVPRLAGLLGQAGDLARSVAALVHGRHLAGLLGLTLLAWLLEGALFLAVALSVGAAGGVAGAYLAFAAGTLATLVPSAPGYVGTFHYFAMQGVAVFGTPQETAAAFAILVHLILWLSTTLVGVAFMLTGLGLRQAPAPTAAAPSPSAPSGS